MSAEFLKHTSFRLLPLAALVPLAALTSPWWLAVPVAAAPAGDDDAGVVAELWPLGTSKLATESAPRLFDIWRSQTPPANGTTLSLEKLTIPARAADAMVRVRGVLIPPRTCAYAFFVCGDGKVKIDRPDDTELWLEDDKTGEWKLVQRNGNPNNRSGRVTLEQGVPRRFELWTTGKREVSVEWEAKDWDPVLKGPVVHVAREVLPAACMRARKPLPADKMDDGLGDGWRHKWGLAVDSGEGPNGPFGDPDADGLLNWQEKLAGTNPLAADTEGRDGLVRWEVWRDIPGKYVFDLTRSGAFSGKPREIRYLNRLEIPVANGDNYGSRLRGWIKAPASGEYTFMIIADDSAELWLGETESWQSKKMIARADQKGAAQLRWARRTEDGEKPLFPGQLARVTLQKGRQYYVEVLHKQDTSQDHCAVAWVLPGTTDPEVIGAGALTSWKPSADDADDDGLPDAWQQAAGLTAEGVDPMMRDACADPDHDGLSNWEEWQAGSDPLRKDDTETEHRLSCQSWTACPGNQVRDLAHDARFPARPDFTTLVDNMDFSDEGDRYGVRLRGYLTAPEDGPYVFSISGNNACTLYLADSEDKFTKRAIAWISRGTGWRSFAWQPTQRSEPLVMKKGERRYIEVLFKRGEIQEDRPNQRDHSSVAWTRPGRDEAVIDAEYFSPYQADPRDLDDDDLPDEWERNHGLDAADPAGANGAWGDPDGDWLENFREFQAGLDPQAADVHGSPGLALWERWDDIHGKLPGLKASPSFPLAATRREWLTSLEGPQGMGVFYGSRLRALLVAPVTGDYTFAIAGHNGCELSLSPTESKYDRRLVASVENASKFREWERHPTQVSEPVRLEAGGRYFIEALHVQDKNTDNKDHLSVAWKIPGAAGFEVIAGDALIAFAGDPGDLDDDDLPDDWEKANGLDPTRPDGDLDPDGDGLTNREEYHLGTRADLADSDGDGLNDGDELRVYHTDPLVKDTVPPVEQATLPLADYSAPAGDWMLTAGGTLRSIARHGEVSFPFDIEAPGIHAVRLDATAVSPAGQSWRVPVIARVDGTEIGRAEVAPQGSLLTWLTPWLPAGRHIVTIDNRNVRINVGLEIHSVVLLRHEGLDTDGNAIPDWMEKLLRDTNRLAAETDVPLDSAVSPACLEGTTRLPGEVVIEAEGIAAPVGAGLGGAWYADVPLAAEGETKVEARFEKGAIRQEVRVRWTAVNVFSAPETMRVRVGDSLKLRAFPPDPAGGEGATCRIGVDGTTVLQGDVSGEAVVRFTEPGEHVVEAEVGGPQGASSARMVVEVFAADFGEPLNLSAGDPRVWSLPGVPRELTVTADEGLRLDELPETVPPGRGFTALWPNLEPAAPRVLARLSEGGPVVAATTVNVFRLIDAAVSGDAQVVRILADGTRVVEIGYVIHGRVPADFSLWIELIVTDAVFANGETRWHLTAADFDENGEARLLVYKAPGDGVAYVCHWNKTYSDDPVDGNADAADPDNPAVPSPTAPAETPTDSE